MNTDKELFLLLKQYYDLISWQHHSTSDCSVDVSKTYTFEVGEAEPHVNWGYSHNGDNAQFEAEGLPEDEVFVELKKDIVQAMRAQLKYIEREQSAPPSPDDNDPDDWWFDGVLFPPDINERVSAAKKLLKELGYE